MKIKQIESALRKYSTRHGAFALSTLCAVPLLSSIMVCMAPQAAFAKPKKAEIVIDAQTGEIIHEDQATEARYPASITKVMTLYLLFDAIENGEISLDDELVFSKNAASQPPTKLGVKTGNSVDIETAILALVVKSSNDVAVAIAERLGGSEENFALKMTQKAKELGMIGTNFANASGLPNPNQVSTAEDLAKLAIAIRRDFPREFHYFSTESFEFAGETLNNHNHLVGKTDGVDGLKTGYTNASGYNLATTSVRDGKILVTVVMGGASWRSRDARVSELIDQSYAEIGAYSKTAQLSNGFSSFTANDDEFYFAFQKDESPKLVSGNAKTADNLAKQKIASVKVNFGEIEKQPEDLEANKVVSLVSLTKTHLEKMDSNASAAPIPQIPPNNDVALPEFTLRGKIETQSTPLPDFQIAPNVIDVETAKAPSLALVDSEKSNEPVAIRVDFDAFEREEAKQKAEELKAAKLEKQRQLLAAKAIAAEKSQQEKLKSDKIERAKALQAEKERQDKIAMMRGNITVQVGAFKSKDDANSTIKRLAFAFPAFAKSDISKATSSTGTWFRVRFSGIAYGAAKQACEAIVRKGGVCQIISK